MDNKKMISLEISGALKEALRVEAFRRNVNVSALIRQILEKDLREVMMECASRANKENK